MVCQDIWLNNAILESELFNFDNEYLRENTYLPLPEQSPSLVPISFVGGKNLFPPPPLFNLGIHTGD